MASMPIDAMDSDTPSRKRPNDTAASERQQRRSRREKYAPMACNECKKRKIKCSGTTVCQRCKALSIQCVYTANSDVPSTRTSSSSFQNLEAKFATLEKQLNQLQSLVVVNQTQQYIAPPLDQNFAASAIPSENESEGSLSRGAKKMRKPSFIGPTNSLYSLNVGKSSLKSMGVQPDSEPVAEEQSILTKTPKPHRRIDFRPHDTILWMGKDESLRLISVYSEELDPIYPFLDISQTIGHLQLLLDHLKVLPTTFGARSELKAPDFDSRDSDILMMVLASALLIEGLGQSAVAENMVDAVEAARSRRAKVTPADLKEVLILTIMSIYHFHCDEDVLAWRKIGDAARMALEMGLHRTESITKTFPDARDRSWAVKLFWSVYILDRRWALGTGLPCAINQLDVDNDLPEPNDTSPYLQRLITYARISAKASNIVNNSDKMPVKTRRDETVYLDFQIDQWLKTIPPELRMLHPGLNNDSQTQPRSLHRLRVLLYVRANHIKILIHRYSLLSATSIVENMPEAESVVEIAKDTIRVLAHLDRTSDIYQTQQACFNYFLLAPLAALFLAVCHGPSHFSESCRSEFYVALDLIKTFSFKSLVSRRLWKTIRDLKSLGPKLGVTPLPVDENEQPTKGTNEQDDTTYITGPQTEYQTWDRPTTLTLQDINADFHWVGTDGLPDFGNEMTCDLADLYGVAERSARRPMSRSGSLVDNCDIDHLDSIFSLEDNADVSKVLATLF